MTQYNVLRILRGAGARGLCGREVGERLISRVPDVSRLLDRMAEMGLLAKERDAADRRHVTARITPKGRRVLGAGDADSCTVRPGARGTSFPRSVEGPGGGPGGHPERRVNFSLTVRWLL